MDDLTVIRVAIEDHVAVVTMDNPPVNAQDRRFNEEVALVFDRLSEMDEVRCAVLTGAGRVFSAGADIKARAAMAAERRPGDGLQHLRRARECYHSVYECRKPVIAAINGPALGAGLALAASCDILVCSENAVLGLPEVDVGLLGGGRHAMRLFGHSLTRRMMLTGYRVPGPELYRLGVVEACVPQERLMEVAMDLARQVASKSPVATRLAKHGLNAIEFSSLRDGYRFEQELTAELGRYEDSREAMRAFLEKRPPVFKGR
ncbi:enoyl-CoA hydratase/isomerase family protein [Caldovatus aquaticus]|uniref:Enoyl-CoA hydratase/isomerase family protein n=1 Tax=Caldovatus aquaticus TaxID=2865671 RepID=A0ABS7EZY6_9PROT|nr:enoyl-CoA hydratase/isomerase family protein [Caldovatus aquaticus]MBW8268874.1 enoyl-CoA hydratase/isomerase family protein [Caldovatus aquaticus]